MSSIITSQAEYKINLLIEEFSIMGPINSAVSANLLKLDKIFTTPDAAKKLIKAEEDAQKRREAYLKKYNVDVEAFKRDLKAGKDIKVSMMDMFKEMASDLKNTTPSETIKLLIAMAILFMIHTTLFQALVPIAGPIGAMAIVVITIPWFTEEMFKRVGVAKRQSAQTFIGFNTLEFANYMMMYATTNVPMAIQLISRIFPVLMHLVNTLLHEKGYMLDKYRKDYKLNSDNPDLYKNKASVVAGTLHAIWNLGGTLIPGLIGLFPGLVGIQSGIQKILLLLANHNQWNNVRTHYLNMRIKHVI